MAMPSATLIPGLVDAHVHLALALHLPEWDSIEADPVRLAFIAAHNSRLALAAGITTLADCGSRFGVAIAVRDAVNRGDVLGPRILSCGPWLTVTNGHGYFWTRWGLDNADQLRTGVRQVVWQGADFVKIMASGGGTRGTTTNRRRAQYSADELRLGVEDAHRLGKRVVCHINATEAMQNCVEAGVDVLDHCLWLGSRDGIIEFDNLAAERAAKKGLFAGMNCSAVFRRLADRDGTAQAWGTDTTWILHRRMQAAGVTIYVNTDAGGASFERGDLLPSYMVRMVNEQLATSHEVIQMVTSIPAKALGVSDEIGSLETGKQADMLILEANPLEKMATIMNPLAVIRGGKVVVEGGLVRG